MTEQMTENLLVELTEYVRTRYFGKYRGLVRDVEDPENLGRITASVPEVYGGNGNDSPWAMPSVPFAGQNHGLVTLPEVGDGVWIEFEAGDISRPIWTGCWWAQDEIPEPAGPQTRVFVTSGGHKLVMDDQRSKLQLLHSDGAEITLTGSTITLKINSTELVLSATGLNINNGAFEVR